MKNTDNKVKDNMQPSAASGSNNTTVNHNFYLLEVGKPTKVVALVSPEQLPPLLNLEACAPFQEINLLDIFHPPHEGDML